MTEKTLYYYGWCLFLSCIVCTSNSNATNGKKRLNKIGGHFHGCELSPSIAKCFDKDSLISLSLNFKPSQRILALELFNLELNVEELNYLSKLTTLQTLKLRNVTIPVESILPRLTSLKYLDISGNRVQTIHKSFLDTVENIKTLSLDNNPYHCDCRLLWLSKWLLTTHNSPIINQNKQDKILCSSPSHLAGYPVANLHNNTAFYESCKVENDNPHRFRRQSDGDAHVWSCIDNNDTQGSAKVILFTRNSAPIVTDASCEVFCRLSQANYYSRNSNTCHCGSDPFGPVYQDNGCKLQCSGASPQSSDCTNAEFLQPSNVLKVPDIVQNRQLVTENEVSVVVENPNQNIPHLALTISYQDGNLERQFFVLGNGTAITIARGRVVTDTTNVILPTNTMINIALAHNVSTDRITWLASNKISMPLATSTTCKTFRTVICALFEDSSIVSHFTLNITDASSFKLFGQLTSGSYINHLTVNLTFVDVVGPSNVFIVPNAKSFFAVGQTQLFTVAVKTNAVVASLRSISGVAEQWDCSSVCQSGKDCISLPTDTQCYLSKNITLRFRGFYRIVATLSSTVMDVSYAVEWEAKVDQRITYALIVPQCGDDIVVGENKTFVASTDGTSVSYQWSVNGMRINVTGNILTLEIKEKTDLSLSVFSENSISNKTATIVLSPLDSGHIHGVSISLTETAIPRSEVKCFNPLSGVLIVTVNQTTTFDAQLCGGKDFETHWSFGDGTSVVTTKLSTTVNHAYATPGSYNINLTVNNTLNSKRYGNTVAAFDEISSFEVDFSSTTVATNQQIVIKGTTVTLSKPCFAYRIGNDSVWEVLNSSSDNNFTFGTNFNLAGNYTVCIEAQNAVSRLMRCTVYDIQEVVDITWSPPSHSVVGSTVVFPVNHASGTNTFYTWDFGDGTQATESFSITSPLQNLHQFSTEGDFNVTLSFYNKVTPVVVFSKIINIRHSVQGFRVEHQHYVAVNDPMALTLVYPHNTTFTYEFDGLVVGKTSMARHNELILLPLVGAIDINITTWNEASSASFASLLFVQAPVQAISLTIATPKQLLKGLDVGAVMQNKTVSLIPSSDRGTNVSFTLTYDDNTMSNESISTHVFDSLGLTQVTVFGFNGVSNLTSQFKVDVQVDLQLASIRLNTSIQVAMATQPTLLITGIPAANSIKFDWLISSSDGNLDRQRRQTNAAQAVVTFFNAGEFAIGLNMSNQVSMVSLVSVVRVEEAVGGITISFNGTQIDVNNVLVVPSRSWDFAAIAASGTNPHFEWILDNVTASSNPAANIDLQSPGLHTLQLKVFNNISSEIINLQIQSLQQLSGLRIKGDPIQHVSTFELNKLEVTVGGDNVSYRWFVDGVREQQGPSPVFNRMYTTPKNYTVTVITFNPVSSEQATSVLITAQDPIQDLTVAPTIVLINESTLLNASISTGTDVSFSWLIGSDTFSGVSASFIAPHSGPFLVTVTASNQIDNVIKTINITGKPALNKIKVETTTPNLPTGEYAIFYADIISPGLTYEWRLNGVILANETGPQLRIMLSQDGNYRISVRASNGLSMTEEQVIKVDVFNPPDKAIIEECCNLTHSNNTIMLKGDVLSGSNITYNWTVTHADGTVIHYTGKEVEISSGGSGNVTVRLFAFNAIGNASRTYSFVVLDEIKDPEIWTSQTIIPLGEEVTISYLTRSGTGLRYTWAINGQPLDVGNVNTFTRKFTAIGNHTITASVVNDLIAQPIFKTVVVSVEAVECPPPILSVQGSTTRKMIKSMWLYTEAKVDFNCSAYAPVSSWTLHLADEQTRCQYDDNLAIYDVPGDDLVVSSPLLAIPSGVFDVGIYCTRYTMVYGSVGQFKRMIGIRVEVLPTPLLPQIVGGNKRKYAHNDTIIVDGSQTIDPDLGLNGVPDLEYRWVSDYVNSSSINAPSTVRLNTSWSNQSSVVLPPNNILPGRAYKVEMYVRRKGTDEVEHTSQTVITTFGAVPLIDITCVTCSAYKTLKYAKSRTLKFTSQCTNCGNFDVSFMSFQWTVIDEAGKVVSLQDNETTTGLSSQLLIIEPGVLDGTQDYQFQMELSLGSARGESSVVLFPNQSPENGSCSVWPSLGYSFVTMFNFTCHGWQDEDNIDTPFLTWIVTDSAAGPAIVYRGIQSSIGTQLSIGNTTANGTVGVTILIEDAFGALTVGYNGSVQVYPPPDVVNVNEFLQSKINNELLGLAEARDSNKVLAFVQSSTALLSKGDDNEAILSSLVKSAAGIRSSSIEGIEQTMTTTKMAVNAGEEQSLDFNVRILLTDTLDEVVSKLKSFSGEGLAFSQTASLAIFDIFSNNFGGLEYFGDRKRSLVSKSSDNLLEFYKAQLQTVSVGERPLVLESSNIHSRLQRSKPEDILKEHSKNGCYIRPGENTLDQYNDVLEIFESSSVDQFPPIFNATAPSSQLCRLSYFLPDKQPIKVKDLPEDKAIEINISQTKAPEVNNSLVTVNVTSGGIRNGALNLADTVKGEAVHVEITYATQSSVVGVNGSILFEILTRVKGEDLNTSIVLESRMLDGKDGSLIIFISQSDFDPDLIHSLRITNNFTVDATVAASVYTSSCLFWNTTLTDWDTRGCYVSNASSREQTKCICNHLTSFSALFKLKPNPIDFSLLLELDIASNPVALSVCLGVIALFFIIFAISFRTDEKERRNDHFIPFLGPDEFFKYEIKVTTGGQIGAGTTARVGIQIFGRRARTKPRLLFKGGGLKRNSVDIFQFASGRGLGNIHKIHVWHDNSGADPSWHVKSIIIKNLLDGRKYFFFCNSWLALDTEGGVIEKDFAVASKQMIRQFSLIFDNVVGRAFHDHHLWLSVLQRPTLSSFTRVQRVACCFTLILSYMAINAMWFGVAPDGDVDLFLGFRGFSYEEVFIGIISSLMVFPLNLFLVFLFRKSKPSGYQKYNAYGEVKMHTLKGRRRYSLESIEVDDLRRKPSEASEVLETPLRRCKTKINLGGFRLPLLYRGEQYYAVLPESNITDIDGDQSEVFEAPNEPSSGDRDNTPPRERSSSGPRVQFVDADLDLDTPLMPAPPPEDIAGDGLIDRTKDKNEEMAENFELFCRAVQHAREVSQTVRASDATEAVEASETNDVNPETRQEMRRLFDQFRSRSVSGSSTSASDSGNIEHLPQKNADDLPDVDYSIQHKKYLDEMDDLPDVYERPSNMHGPLPSWCNLVAYFLCLSISGFSIVLILIYGQDFGREKAVKWVTALFVGLLQDMFITYPVLLVTGAAVLALVVKPTNLDYGDFVECPVVPGVRNLKDNMVNPLRGLALQSAKREGMRKHRLRVIVKRAVFLVLFSWLLLSVLITSFQPTTIDLKTKIMNELDSGNSSFTSIKNASEFWSWSHDTLWPFLESTTDPNVEWSMIGSAQLRQLRIGSNVLCDPSNQRTCHIMLDDNSEQTNDVMNGNWAMEYHSSAGITKDPAWSYHTNNGGSRETSGSYQSYRSDRGYIYSFSNDNLSGAKAKWSTLERLKWIDLHSSAVFVDVVLHNRNITDTYAVISLLMESSLSGFTFTKMDVRVIVSDLYTVNLDYFRLTCEVIVCLIFSYLWLKLIVTFFRYGFKISLRRHSILFLLSICIFSLIYITTSIYRVAMLAKVRSDLETGYPIYWDPSLPDAISATVTVMLGIIAVHIFFKVIQLLSWLRNYVLVSFAYKKAVGYLFLTAFFVTLIALGFTSYGYAMFDDSYRYRDNPLESVFDRLLLSWSSDNRWRFSTYHYIFAITWNVLLYAMYVGVIATYLSAFFAVCFKDFHISYARQTDDSDRLLLVYLWRRITGKARNVGFSEISLSRSSMQPSSSNPRNLFIQSRVFSTKEPHWNYAGGNGNANGGPPLSIADAVAQQDREEIRRDEFYGALERQMRSRIYGLTVSETPL